MSLIDWSPDSDYDIVKTNDPNGEMWAKVYDTLVEENRKETAEFFGVDEIIFPEWEEEG